LFKLFTDESLMTKILTQKSTIIVFKELHLLSQKIKNYEQMKTSILFLFFLLYSFCSLAQSKKTNESDTVSHNSSIEAVVDTIPDLSIFEDDSPMKLTLKYDITSFIKNKLKGEYLDAELHIEYKNYVANKNIRLKARGNNRRETCFFPPIYLNFKTDTIKNTELKGLNKIKLVTHCSTSKTYSAYLLKEYLVYKLYNILTNNSFRVKLLDIDYVDTGKKQRNYEKQGILIEPVELLTKRTNSIEIDGTLIRENNVIEEEADVLALFQFMIANTDWRIKSGHNTKYIKVLDHLVERVTPVPYDFDYSGFVDTHYSFPQSWTSIEDVKEREYLGYCRNSDAEYLKTINLFIEKKDEIFKTIESFEQLPERDRNDLLDFVKSFYDLTDRPETLISKLKTECRTDF